VQTKVSKIDPQKPDPLLIEEAAALIRAGGLVVYPTETVYGLAADIFNQRAVTKIFKVKGRSFAKPLAVCPASLEDLNFLVEDPPIFAREITRHFLPGPLTLIFRRSRAVSSMITCGGETVGIRFPSNPIALSLSRAVKVPLALTSANFSGQPSPVMTEQVLEGIGRRVDLILDGGPTELGMESTVLDLTRMPPVVLREGAIPVQEIERFLKDIGVKSS
jgi:L-threonylcarbamoyladenylate synthase